MPIDIFSETLVSITEAAQIFPGRPNIATVWRWTTAGCRGVKLDTIVSGGRRYTSREAIERFVAASTARANGQPTPTRTPRQRQRSIAAAERTLAEAGI